MSMRAQSVGARRGEEGEGIGDRRRWISGVINGHDYLAKLAPLCISLQPPHPPPPSSSLSLSLSFIAAANLVSPPRHLHPGPHNTHTRVLPLHLCPAPSKLCMGSSHRNNAPALLFSPPRDSSPSLSVSLPLQVALPLLVYSVLLFFSSRPVLVPPNSHYPKQFAIAIGPDRICDRDAK